MKPSNESKCMKKIGRPHTLDKDENLKALEDLCVLQCTYPEIAAFFGVHPHKVEEWAARPEYREVIDRGRNKGLISLRRAQFNAALAGDRTMLVWLGKQLLGQRDQASVQVEGGVTPLEIVVRYSTPPAKS